MSFLIKPIKITLKSNHRSFYSKNILNFLFTNKKSLGKLNIVKLGEVSPELLVPEHIEKPKYYYEEPDKLSSYSMDGKIEIKSEKAIEHMRESCKLAAKILKDCGKIINIGTTTNDIDEFIHQEIITANAYPSPLRYLGFPKSVCTSVNNVACHGIPDNRKLMDGDIVNVDITVYYKGYHGDCSTMYSVGNVDESGQFLMNITQNCLNEAIKLCKPGASFTIIGKCIENIALNNNLRVVPAFTGHGIGTYFHGPPEILHFRNSMGGLMAPGMTFTIEPVLTLGEETIEIQEDGWTAMSIDDSRSAQYEHTVLITEDGVEVLTQ